MDKDGIAVVGAGMRLPGRVHDLPGLAQLLWGGADPVREVPPERWDTAELTDPDITAPGRMRSRWGSFLDDLDLFDAAFFGIAPREAASLDPQQRLLLEVGWEALENAGCNPRALAGTATGVFVGVAGSDYGRALMADRAALDAYGASGTAGGTAAGRLSYVLDLAGPCMAVDTACSSSLVAVHLAVQSLRLRESDTALAGGVNVVLSPEVGISYSKARMLSPDGRCRSFSADAQGYVRGEGCCLLVLRRLSDALAAGDRILGVIRGSATNQDGRSAGLTAPRGSAQQSVLSAALRAARVHPHDISFVEAHGSGTPLGDSVEMEALGAVLCADRPQDRPLHIGSIKSNIGHLEAAGGAAGILKVLLAFEQEAIPPNLHFAEPNPLIAWDRLPVRIPTRAEPWPRGDVPRLAGVNSFGFGGSNAHVVLEEPPAPGLVAPRPATPPGPSAATHLLPLSARTEEALFELVRRVREVIDDARLAAICQTAAIGRAHFTHRVAAVGASAEELRGELDAILARGRVVPTATAPPPVAFAVSAPGASDDAVMTALRASSPAFAAVSAPGARLQPALARLWAGWGVQACALAVAPGGADEAAAIGVPVADVPDGCVLVDLGAVAPPDPWRIVLVEAGRLYRAGVELDWAAFHRGAPRTPVAMPTYPFQRRRHWSPAVRAFGQRQAAATPPAAPPAATTPPATTPPATTPPEARPATDQLRAAPAGRRHQMLVERLLASLKSTQGEGRPLHPHTPFTEAGIDPLASRPRELLQAMLGRSFPPTLLLNNRNVDELARDLLDRLGLSAAPDDGRRMAPLADADVRARLAARLAKLR